MWVMAGVVLGSALSAGTMLAQGYQPTSPTTSAATKEKLPPPRVYNPVQPETLGIASSAELLYQKFIKVPDIFYDEVAAFPDDAVRAGFMPQNYVAFRTRPDGSNLICFVPRMVTVAGSEKQIPNPELESLAAAVRGGEIFIEGQVGPRMFVGDGGATALAVDHVFLGHEEPKPAISTEKKPVGLTVERLGPDGKTILKQEFQIPKPGVKYRIPDPADPQNSAKDIYVTLQF
jgi:hypothetical protein